MKAKHFLFLAFLSVVILQFSLPIYSIKKQLEISDDGASFLFYAEISEPYRRSESNFINVSLWLGDFAYTEKLKEVEEFIAKKRVDFDKANPVDKKERFVKYFFEKVFVEFQKSDGGFAKISGYSTKPYASGNNWIKATTSRYSMSKNEIIFNYIFKKFYASPKVLKKFHNKIDEISKIKNADLRRKNCVVDVRILKGKWVIFDVRIDGESLREADRF